MTPPSIHKLRSLAARLYPSQGYDPQNLLGHKNAETTAAYKDSRGAEWIDAAAQFRRNSEEILEKPNKLLIILAYFQAPV